MKLEEYMSSKGVVYYKVGILGIRKENATEISGKYERLEQIPGDNLWWNLIIEDQPPMKVSAEWVRDNEPIYPGEPLDVLIDSDKSVWLIERVGVADRRASSRAPSKPKIKKEKLADQFYEGDYEKTPEGWVSVGKKEEEDEGEQNV